MTHRRFLPDVLGPLVWLCCFILVLMPFTANSAEDNGFPNGSFEKVDAQGMPVGWSCTIDGQATPLVDAETTASGQRAIRVTEQGHATQWVSEPVSVQPDAKYLIGFKINAAGNRHWSYALAQNCLAVRLYKAGSQDYEETEREVRVIRTHGWSQAWLNVTIPGDTDRIQLVFRTQWPPVGDHQGPAARLARFWYGMGAGHEGRLLIDDVTLERKDNKEFFLERTKTQSSKLTDGFLRVVTLNGTTKIPAPARLVITDDSGRQYRPKDAYYYSATGGFVSREDGIAEMSLPPGTYTIRAMRGFVQKPQTIQAEVKAGEVTEVEFPFKDSAAAWPKEGWVAGDHHLHLFFHGETQHPLMTIPSVCQVGRAEGMQYLSFQAEFAWMKRWIDGNPDFEAENFICEVSHEITDDFWGHVDFFNAVGIPDLPAPPALWPSNFGIREMVNEKGGYVVYTHPFSDMTDANSAEKIADPGVGLIARGLPVDAFLGQNCMVDIISSEDIFDIYYKMRTLERLWNLGIRFGVGGSSDAYVDQGTILPGDFRTFALPESLDFEALADAYREGRTFASNGPLLKMRVNDQNLGDTVDLPAPKSVQVSVKAHSWWGLSKIEIVQNAEVVKKTVLEPGCFDTELNFDLPVETGGYVYARVWGPSSPELRNVQMVKADREISIPPDAKKTQFAMTSPIWLQVADKPQPIKTEDVQFFESWLDALSRSLPGYRARLEQSGELGTKEQFQEHEKQARELVNRARKALRERTAQSTRSIP